MEKTVTIENLTYRKAQDFYNALTALDGAKVIVGNEVHNMAYRIGADGLWNIVQNKKALHKAIDQINEFQKALVNQYSDGKGTIDHEIKSADGDRIQNPKFTEFMIAFDAKLNEVYGTIQLRTISVKDLNLLTEGATGRTNDIPASVLEHLSDMLTDIPE